MASDNAKAFSDGFKLAQAIENKIVMEMFERICEEAIDVAVSQHNFDNQTLNLENSYAYAIYHYGKMVKFKSVGTGEGASDAQEFCENYVTPFGLQNSWQAVIVAGAWYGSLLEGYIRRTAGERSGVGEKLRVLSDSFNFVSLESIRIAKQVARG